MSGNRRRANVEDPPNLPRAEERQVGAWAPHEIAIHRHLDYLSYDIIFGVSAPDGTITYLSEAFERITGWPAAVWRGRPFGELLHPAELPLIHEMFRQALRGAKLLPYTLRVSTPTHGVYRLMELTSAPRTEGDRVVGLVGIARDVTNRQRPMLVPTQETTRPSLPAPRDDGGDYPALVAAAHRQAQELALLDQVRTVVTRELDLAHVFRTVVEAIAKTFGYTQVSLFLIEDDTLRLQHQVGYDQMIERIPLTSGVAGRVARTGQPVFIPDVHSDPGFLEAMPGIVSEVCVPLIDQERVVGVLNVESTGGVLLATADLRLMQALSDHVAAAIGRARLYTQVRESERQYRFVVETVREVIFQADPLATFTFLNPAWTELTGYSPAESLGTSLLDYLHPEDRPRAAATCARFAAGTLDACRVEVRYQTKDGQARWMEVNARAVEPAAGVPAGIAGTCADITERKLAEEALRRQNEELAALHETTLGLINQLDTGQLLEAIIARAAALVGSAHGYLYVHEPESQELVVRAGTGIFSPQVGYRLKQDTGLAGRVWATGEPFAVSDYNSWDGHQTDLEWLGVHAVLGLPLRLGAVVVGVIGLAYVEEDRSFHPSEIALLTRFAQLAALALENARLYTASQQELADRRRAEATLAYLARHDPLTNLPNRLQFRDRLEEAISGPPPPLVFALLIMDLDRFKEVNDTLGHQMGDRLLSRVGERLRASLRVTDTVARIGGDEFAVLLPGAEGRAASRIARKLLRALEQPFGIEGHTLAIGASIGIAVCPEHGGDAETLLRRADVAMYHAKGRGLGYALYSANQDPYSADHLALVGDLRRAVEQDELELHYQIKVSLRTGHPTGVEALVRWPHRQHGLLRPDDFIPLAEQTGLIKALSACVLNTALRQCRAWQTDGLTIPVAVNLSMWDLRDPQLPDTIAQLLAAWGVDAGLLRVEIAEGSAMADPGRTLGVLYRLRELGVGLAIDDFGTGNSALAQLKRLPVDQLKIDKTFIREMIGSPSDIAIVRSTIELGHNLDLTVVAEGVENRQTWDLLAALGCDEAQGYYLGAPLPPAELARWVRDGKGRLAPAHT